VLVNDMAIAMLEVRERKVMGLRGYSDTRHRIIWEEKSRRQQIIDEFFRAYEAARQANRVFVESYVYGTTHAARALPPCLSLLGLSWPCTAQEIKQAFRSKVKTVHPDHGGNSADFQALHRAYKEALTLVTA
jgi:hypothetical protein